MSPLAPACTSIQLSGALANVRVGLVHDWLTGMRGGEKVLESICELFPGAPLYTLLHNRGSVSPIIEDRRIVSSLLQRLPFAARNYRRYLPLFPLCAELNKVSDCDLVISTSHAIAKAMVSRKAGRPLHICYIHTPMRYVWDRFDDYFSPARVGRIATRCFFGPVAKGLQRYDLATNDRVDMFIANSRFVAEQAKRLYNRHAEVLPPPVNVERFTALGRAPEDWYLVVSALAPYKRVDHAVAACAALGRPLKVVGFGPELVRLRRLASSLNAEVQFLGFVSDADLGEYYRRARALLFPGVEDFGIVPVEAIASGCPVIALGVGGVLDSMTPLTAVFYTDPTVESLREAILRFESSSFFNDEDLRARAQEFSKQHFRDKFQRLVWDSISAAI